MSEDLELRIKQVIVDALMLEDVKPADPKLPFAHRLTMGDPAGEIVRIAREIVSLHGTATTGRWDEIFGEV